MTRPGSRPRAAARVGLRDARGFGLVEAVIAIVVLAIGLMAIAGLALTSAAQTRIAGWRTGQTLAGQLVLERVHRDGYDAAASGSETLTVGGFTYTVTRTVTSAAPRVKQVDALVSGAGTLNARTFSTRLYRPRPLPGGPP